jgi:hypothetical protein
MGTQNHHLLTLLPYFLLALAFAVQPPLFAGPNLFGGRKLQEIQSRLSTGFGKLLPNHILCQKIKARKKRGGRITYSEHMLTNTVTDDFWKIFRAILTLGYSREFFLYGYVLGPVISSTPKAWASWPSPFDLPRDKKAREDALAEKRIVALSKVLGEVTQQANPENDPKIRERGEKNIEIVNNALRSKDSISCLNAMKEYIYTDKRHSSKVYLKACSGGVVKSILTAIGGEGLPNVPLINRLNCNEISNIIKQISKSDEVLDSLDIQKMSDREVLAACRERSITASNVAVGRADLSQWLTAVKCHIENTNDNLLTQPVLYENMFNKRLALMGYYIARDFKKADTSVLFRSAVGL